jgi:tetrahydromethanopterin S-methyltransferase subunit B
MKWLLILTVSVLLVSVLACGETQEMPNIDATVEARVMRLEATVDALKPSLVPSTQVPLSTYTPFPTN